MLKAQTTPEELVARESITNLVERKGEIESSVAARRKHVTRLSIKAEQTEDPDETLELIKFENEKVREEESRLEGIAGAIELARSDENVARLRGTIAQKARGYRRAADLLEERAKEFQKIEDATLALAAALKRATELQKETAGFVVNSTTRTLHGHPHEGENPGSGPTRYGMQKLVEAIDGHIYTAQGIGNDPRRRAGPLCEYLVEGCLDAAHRLRAFDESGFPEHDELKAIQAVFGDDRQDQEPQEAA